jgi:hypothetical protein
MSRTASITARKSVVSGGPLDRAGGSIGGMTAHSGSVGHLNSDVHVAHPGGGQFRSRPSWSPFSLATDLDHNLLKLLNSFWVGILILIVEQISVHRLAPQLAAVSIVRYSDIQLNQA